MSMRYYSPHSNGKYLKKGPHDLGKWAIPPKERCEGFDELWNEVFEQVMETWERVPVKNISEFDEYCDINMMTEENDDTCQNDTKN